jgi:DNA-binding transcriptional ArsR family regulator
VSGLDVGSLTNSETKEPADLVIDRIRHDIQGRLDQLLAEAEKLRRALAALDPRERSTAARPGRSKPKPASKDPAPQSSAPKTPSPKPTSARTRTRAASAASTPARTAPGATKAKVLGALSSGGGLTAGEVAKATGLGRATVSTTLSKLAKSGQAVKAERGYRLPDSGGAPSPGQGSASAAEE